MPTDTIEPPSYGGLERAERNSHIDRDAISEFCQRHSITKLSFFGSVLRPDFHEGSDVDILVEFDSSAKIGLLARARMAIELEEMLGRAVDFRRPTEISPYIRDRVMGEARAFYVR